jgi:DnaJ-class molecular chaperone
MSMREVTTVFGVSQSKLSAMSRSALTRLYRKKAQQMHPDKGGDHEQFIELTTAYNELLRSKL